MATVSTYSTRSDPKAPDDAGKQQEVLESLQKNGTLKRSTVVHVSPTNATEPSGQVSSSNDWKPLNLEERRVVLSDQTQIIVESENEFIFIGPTCSKLVLSCFPLFCIPNTANDSPLFSSNRRISTEATPTSSSLTPKNNGWITFSNVTPTTDDPSPPIAEDFSPPTIVTSNTDIPDVPIDVELPGDIFTLVDPFAADTDNVDNGVSSTDFDQSTRSRQISDAFEKAKQKNGLGRENDCERGYSDSDDNIADGDKIHINYISDARTVKGRAGSVSFVAIGQTKQSNGLVATPLPVPPPTVFPHYVERGGWMIKLSHQKGMFGDRWQKRYFILNGPKLSYFKKYGDSHPRGVIYLIPGSWCRSIPQGTPRMSDAVAKTNRSGVISVNRCLAVHKPSNYAATLSALVASDGVADVFNSQTVALSNTQDSSRTFYMIASSEQERHAWKDAITQNINAYKASQEALDVACEELKNILKGIGSNVPEENLPSILLAVHTRKTYLANSISRKIF